MSETNLNYDQVYSNIIQSVRTQRDIDTNFLETKLKGKNIELVRYLSRGPNSLIYVGKHQNSNKLITIKVLLKDQVENLGGVIVRRNLPYDRLYVDNKVAKVYEILHGGSQYLFILAEFYKDNLAKILLENGGPLKESFIRDVFKNVFQGLNHLHYNKIAHRNMKLENILLDENLHPVISDYNYTIVIENLDNYEKLLATSLPYLAPEIISKIPYDPIIADIWSVGVCLFIVLNNSLPFQPNGKLNSMNFGYKHRDDIEQEFSSKVKDVIKSMLEMDVNRRTTTLSLINDSWFE